MATPTPKPDVQSTVAQTFARFCTSLEYEALPPLVVERAKHFFIDYIAIALRGSILDSSRPMRMLAAARPIPGGATLLGRPEPVHAAWAALANGMAAHSMELDDTFLPGSIHNESFVFSPALALAEERGASGKRFITAVVRWAPPLPLPRSSGWMQRRLQMHSESHAARRRGCSNSSLTGPGRSAFMAAGPRMPA
ncbi:hypothetical protein HDG35_005972 [Paraburkholderia sp. JPY681]|nr:hypothetical protein [Paraburkholderia atlantica]